MTGGRTRRLGESRLQSELARLKRALGGRWQLAFDVLIHDLIVNIQRLEQGSQDGHALAADMRNFIRAAYAGVEGVVHIKRELSCELVKKGKGAANTLRTIDDLDERPLREKILRTFSCLANLTRSTVRLEDRADGPAASLFDGIKVRNRITHPKSEKDLMLSRELVAKIRGGVAHYFSRVEPLVTAARNIMDPRPPAYQTSELARHSRALVPAPPAAPSVGEPPAGPGHGGGELASEPHACYRIEIPEFDTAHGCIWWLKQAREKLKRADVFLRPRGSERTAPRIAVTNEMSRALRDLLREDKSEVDGSDDI